MFKFFRRSKSDRADVSAGTSSSSSSHEKNSKKKNRKENPSAIEKLSTLENSFRWSRADAATNVVINKALVVEDQIVRKMDDLKKSNRNAGDDEHVVVVDRSVRHSHNPAAGNSVDFSPYRKEKSTSRNEIVDLTRDERKAAALSSSQLRRYQKNQNDQQQRLQSNTIDKKNANPSLQHESHLLLQQKFSPSRNATVSIPISDQSATNSFNPINKSRAFFNEIMGKNRNRNRNKNRNKENKPYDRVENSVSIAASVAAAATSVSVKPDQDQQNKSNESTTAPQKNKLECPNPPAIDTNRSSVKSIERERYENVNKFFENENENDFENFGYQITKSKNRTNLVMNYEGEDRQDKNEGIGDDENEQQNFEKISGNFENTNGGGTLHVTAENAHQPVCADAPSDANRCESSYFEHEENYQSNFSTSGGIKQNNHNDDDQVIIIGDLNLQTDHIYAETDCYNENEDRPHCERPEPQQHQYLYQQQQQLHHPFDGGVAATALESQDDDRAEQRTNSAERNFENDRLQIDKLDEQQQQLSELTECDRDQRQEQIDAANMGQDSSKSAWDRHTRRSPSDHVHSSNIVIPTITIADYSDDSFKATKSINNNKSNSNCINNTTIDSDIFYDTENFDSDPSAAQAGACSWGGLMVNSADNDSNLKFVSCESDDVIIEDDPDSIDARNLTDIPTTIGGSVRRTPRDDSAIDYRSSFSDDFSSNRRKPSGNSIISERVKDSASGSGICASDSSSSTNSSDSGKHTDSPDSGIELIDESRNYSSISSEHLLRTDNRDSESFVRGGSTDCDESFLFPSDNEDPEQTHTRNRQEYQQYHLQSNNNSSNIPRFENPYKQDKAILIDSISLPDVVVESTSGMGNSQSIKMVEHIEDHRSAPIIQTDHNDNNTRDLVNQEARYSAQLEEAQKIIFNTQAKVNELQSKIDSLEKELSIKSWNVDRLQGELQAANTEDACVRRRMTLLQDEILNIKQKYSESEYDLSCRYEELKTKHKEQLDNYRHTQNFANALQTQLAFAKSDIENLRSEKQKLCEEKDEEVRKLQEALRKSELKQKELEEKWQKEFETLRTQNADREEHLMADCEWQLRTMQKTCKDKVDAAQKQKNEALQKANEISNRAAEQLDQVTHLIPLEAEIKQLRGLTNEQKESLVSMSEQMEILRGDLEMANEQLEEEIENVRKIRQHCENELSDKDRQMVQRIDEVRGNVAVEWERRLLEEMTRLKQELEMVHADERREALDKLQVEHIEEIKALTCRFDANEEELRIELDQLSEELREKTQKLNEIQDRTSAALLETRLHLERADSEYQIAMNRENRLKEELVEQLQSDFDKEKTEMEEKFRERLNQVKDEFAKELANTTEELKLKHRKQIEQQWEKLIAEKEEALQSMENRYRIRLEEADNRVKELEIEHHRDMKEMKTNFVIERTTLESRDLQNSQEIEQLHRKCRCLTNLFEEMRMRYERREPRPEDLREIAELRERCESQERDLHALTERLREIQIERENEIAAQQNQQQSQQRKSKVVASRKPLPKTIPTNCDVIYEENEERESPHKENNGIIDTIANRAADSDGEAEHDDDGDDKEDDDDEESEDEESDENEEDDSDEAKTNAQKEFKGSERFEINDAIAAES